MHTLIEQMSYCVLRSKKYLFIFNYSSSIISDIIFSLASKFISFAASPIKNSIIHENIISIMYIYYRFDNMNQNWKCIYPLESGPGIALYFLFTLYILIIEYATHPTANVTIVVNTDLSMIIRLLYLYRSFYLFIYWTDFL